MMKKMLLVLAVCMLCLTACAAMAETVNVSSGDTGLDIHEGVLYAGIGQKEEVTYFYFTPVTTQNYYLCYTQSENRYAHIRVYDTVRNTYLISDYYGSEGQKTIGCWISMEKNYRYRISVYRTYYYNSGLSSAEKAGNFTFSICSAIEHADVKAMTDRLLPTCTEDGYANRVCNRCGTEVERKVYPALGHTLEAWHTGIAPTCSMEGRATRRCSTCLAIVEEKVLEKTAHTPSAKAIMMQEATCVQPGYQAHVCTQCMTPVGDEQKPTETDWIYIAPKGHTPADAYEVKAAATCTETGLKTLTCTDCGMVIDEVVIPKLDHAWSAPVLMSADAEDYETSCLICGEKTRCSNEMWPCEDCGAAAHGNFCWNCGTAKPAPLSCVNPDCLMVMPEDWAWPMCPSCGTKLPTK